MEGVSVGEMVGAAGSGHDVDSIRDTYGGFVDDLISPVAGPMKRKLRKRQFGETSDDSVFTLAVARSLLWRPLYLCRRRVAVHLRSIHDRFGSYNGSLDAIKAADSLDYFHPTHGGAGAAMRVCPIGIVWPSWDLNALVVDTVKASVITHAPGPAVEAACAASAAISAAIDGLSGPDIRLTAVGAADSASEFWGRGPKSTVSEKIRLAVKLTDQWTGSVEDNCVQFNTEFDISRDAPSVVATAIAVATTLGDARAAIIHTTNLGWDADTTASIAAAISAAMSPESLPRSWVNTMEVFNNHGMALVGRKIGGLRGKLEQKSCIQWSDGLPSADPSCRCDLGTLSDCFAS